VREHGRWQAAAGYAALVLLVVASWALRFAGHGTVTPLDTLLYFWPVYQATAARLADGVLPLWNPYQLCGIPWIATLQAGVFYPPHALYVLLPLHVAFMASNVLHLVLMAVATAIFVRRLGLGAAAALVAAVVFTLRGVVPTLQFSPNHLEAIAWLPVGAIACVELVERPGRRAMALLAGATGMSLLAGYPQPTVYAVYTWATLWAALVLDARPDRRMLVRAGLGFAVAVGLGALVAAVQLLPAVELTRLATRAPRELEERAMFPISAAFTPALIPLRFGAIVGTPSSWGVAVLALVPAALFATRRRVVAWWAVAFAIATALAALGDLTPAFAAYKRLPGLGWFRNPSRLLTVTELGVALAAAFGLDAIVGPSTARRRRIAAVVAVLGAAGLVRLANDGWAPADAFSTVVARAGAVAVAAALAVMARPAARRAGLVALTGLALVEMSTMPWGKLRLPYAASDVARLREHETTLRAIAGTAGHDRVWRHGAALLPENGLKLPTLYGLRAINDYEPLNLARQADVLTYLSEGAITRDRPPWLFAGEVTTLTPPPGIAPPATRRRLIDLMATRFFVVPAGSRAGDPALSAFIERGGFVMATDGERFKVFANPSAVPRAFVTYRTRRAPPAAELLPALSRRDFDPLLESFVEGDPLPAAPAAPRGHPATFVRDDEAEVELEATLERPGLVVLADSFYPGWHATVDGRPAPILATNHLFRGVPVDAGTHRVRFVYAPASVRIGAVSSALALAVLVWLYAAGSSATAATLKPNGSRGTTRSAAASA
jgi:hypothetical protein